MHLGALQIFKRVQTVQFPIEMPKFPHKIPIYKLPTLKNSIVPGPIGPQQVNLGASQALGNLVRTFVRSNQKNDEF